MLLLFLHHWQHSISWDNDFRIGAHILDVHRLVWFRSPTLPWQSMPHLLHVKAVDSVGAGYYCLCFLWSLSSGSEAFRIPASYDVLLIYNTGVLFSCGVYKMCNIYFHLVIVFACYFTFYTSVHGAYAIDSSCVTKYGHQPRFYQKK